MFADQCKTRNISQYFTIFLPQNPLKSIRRSDKTQETVGFDQKTSLNLQIIRFLLGNILYGIDRPIAFL